MTPLNNSFSIVAIGAWNPAIFHGQWLTDHVLKDQKQVINFSIPSAQHLPNQMQQPLQIEFEGIRIYPSNFRLQICASQPTSDGIGLVSEVFCKIIKLLTHTPVQSVGLNFGFAVGESVEKFQEWLAEDSAIVNAPKGYSLKSTQVIRQFSTPEGINLNVTANQPDEHQASVSFNYDFGAHPMDWYLESLAKEKTQESYKTTLAFCKDVFDIELDN